MEFIYKLLTNKWFWIGLAALLLLLYIHRNWNVIKVKLFGKKAPTYATDDQGNVLQVTQLDQKRLNQMVENTHASIYAAGGMSTDVLDDLMNLTDQELEYVGKTYKSVYQVSLFKDIDDEWLPFTDLDEKVESRLAALGLT